MSMFYRLGSEIDYQGVKLDTLVVDGDDPPVGWAAAADLFDSEGVYVGPDAAERRKPVRDIKAVA